MPKDAGVSDRSRPVPCTSQSGNKVPSPFVATGFVPEWTPKSIRSSSISRGHVRQESVLTTSSHSKHNIFCISRALGRDTSQLQKWPQSILFHAHINVHVDAFLRFLFDRASVKAITYLPSEMHMQNTLSLLFAFIFMETYSAKPRLDPQPAEAQCPPRSPHASLSGPGS